MAKAMIVLIIAFVVTVSVLAFAEVHVGLAQMMENSGFTGPMYRHMNATESVPQMHESCGDVSSRMNAAHHSGHMH